jgi:hypothetical protein
VEYLGHQRDPQPCPHAKTSALRVLPALGYEKARRRRLTREQKARRAKLKRERWAKEMREAKRGCDDVLPSQ